MDYEQQYRKLEAKLNYLQTKKDMFINAEKFIKKELALIHDETDELTKELLSIIEMIRKT